MLSKIILHPEFQRCTTIICVSSLDMKADFWQLPQNYRLVFCVEYWYLCTIRMFLREHSDWERTAGECHMMWLFHVLLLRTKSWSARSPISNRMAGIGFLSFFQTFSGATDLHKYDSKSLGNSNKIENIPNCRQDCKRYFCARFRPSSHSHRRVEHSCYRLRSIGPSENWPLTS